MKEYEVTATKDKKTNALNLTMQGKLNISNMKGIEEEFKSTVKNCKKCSITLSNIDDADLSIVQLLKAFELNCLKNKIEVTISMNLNEDNANLFAKSGLNNIFNK
ncbi:MAG: STAS domain-containing protein [Salinivirgaceae bacterium]